MNNILENIISEEKTHVRYSDIDFDKSLKPFSLLNFFHMINYTNTYLIIYVSMFLIDEKTLKIKNPKH